MANLTPENRANIIKVRDAILAADRRNFDMRCWSEPSPHGCGTCACIGGWAVLTLFPKDDWRRLNSAAGEEEIGRLLGLSHVETDNLFFPINLPEEIYYGGGWSIITQKNAAEVLNHLLETGEVDWKVITPETETHCE